jgi:hypothetical protein
MSTITLSRPVSARPRPAVRPARPASSAVRLTRRGRLVIFGLALMVMLVLGVVWGSGSVATLHPGTPEPTRIVVVAPGDTHFGIAAGVAKDGQVGEMVEQLQQMNGLDDPMLQVGQHLRVPAP